MSRILVKFKEEKQLDHREVEKEILRFWDERGIFHKSMDRREGGKDFVFFEGPPSANGLPGIHHVMARAIKDVFCRYKTLKGFHVKRKGGWDTHGLPVELSVEQMLGITKKDIGDKVTVEEYNSKCREEVLRYKDVWDDLTRKIGYWLDLDDPYITFENEYIESLWYLLKQLYDKGLLYKGLRIQPYSPAAGTGLSSHELNQPGTYKMVKDTTVVAQFRIIRNADSAWLFSSEDEDICALAWTTTPWTLPSNTALCVGEGIEYVKVRTYNPYTGLPVSVILAKDLVPKYFDPELAGVSLSDFDPESRKIPYEIQGSFMGSKLVGMRYGQLLPYAQPEDGDAFRVISGDFVTTEDGTGIVHIAPSFGADDMRVAEENGIGSLTLVDKQGKFTEDAGELAGRYVKNYKDEEDYESVDVEIAVLLKKDNKAFKVEKYEHSYPHCWRTDKPVLYYPLDSWFIAVTKVKDRLIELNNQINWKPESTGTGRFGNWLENLVDWNLSRTRFWGTPLPIWRTDDGQEEICVGSIADLQEEIRKSVEAGLMEELPAGELDLHKPYVDRIILVSQSGKPMHREPDLIDVWFDSGAMPYAQWHYPFENQDTFRHNFPADFIAEGVDQTRGWFYTLHAIAGMLFDSVAFRNVVSNGLVLDKNGNKMSKRLGNAIDPFETISEYGADATRWYMLSNSQPWDNLKFDLEGVQEVKRKLFGTLMNTYSFFSLYANIDGFDPDTEAVPLENRPEIDRWILSTLNTLIKEVDASLADYEPTRAARAIQDFVLDQLSNWYVRLCRRRFWKSRSDSEEGETDKLAAYQTLYECLVTVSQLMSSIAPFYADHLYRSLHPHIDDPDLSVHLSDFPVPETGAIDQSLEERMKIAQDISSMVLSLRKKENIKVRQPLQKIMVPILDSKMKEKVEKVRDLILSEVNVKEIEYISDTSDVLKKRIKPDFKQLGKKLGPKMKSLAAVLAGFSQADIRELESRGKMLLDLQGEEYELNLGEVEITSEDIAGWLVANMGALTVALDIQITESLKNEGNARELINKIQNERKQRDFNVTDKIIIRMENNEALNEAIGQFGDYIKNETLATRIEIVTTVEGDTFEINEEKVRIDIQKI